VLATVLFTDIVASTEQAGRLGDRRWRELLEVHDELARRLVEEFGGQLIKTTGDGMLATLMVPDGPSAARPPSETSWAASPSTSRLG
jgi:class 3 adenylate cyclase